jgi:hypothetical protein
VTTVNQSKPSTDVAPSSPPPKPTVPFALPDVRALTESDNATIRQAIRYLEAKLALAQWEEQYAEEGVVPREVVPGSKVGLIEMRLASLRLMEKVTSTYAYLACRSALLGR